MPNVTVDELLTILDQRKGAIIGVGLTLRSHKIPNEGMLVNKRGTSKKAGNLLPTLEVYPEGVYHLLRQQVMLGTDYAKAVDRAREREMDDYMGSLPPPPKFASPPERPEVPKFEPEKLWNGKGERAEDYFPRFVARHKEHGGLYLCYRPEDRKPLLSEWYNVATGERIDKPVDFLPPPKDRGSKIQMLDEPIPWEVCKLGNILSVKLKDTLYDIVPVREPVEV